MDLEGVDYLIITALAAETRAVLRKLPVVQQLDTQLIGAECFFAALTATSADGTKTTHRVLVIGLPGIGNTTASTTSAHAILRWQPKNVILVGVAAGIAPEVRLGDIVIADSVLNFEMQKSLDADPFARPDSTRPSPALLSAIRQYALRNMSWKRLLSHPELMDRDFTVRVGAVLSGDKLFMGQEEFGRLKAHWPTLMAADMEASGVAEVISSLADQRPDFLIVRSVSDFAEAGSKDDTWIEYAADIAASLVMGFVASRPSSPQRSRVTMVLDEVVVLEKEQKDRLISELSRVLDIDAEQIRIFVRGGGS